MAVDTEGRAASYQAGRWSDFAKARKAGPLVAVSCGGSKNCSAVSATGNVVRFKPATATWSRPKHLRGLTTPTDISCSSSTACVVVDNSGQAVFTRR